jgi:acetyltransferase-like isoleucine patch superfamily enzyme
MGASGETRFRRAKIIQILTPLHPLDAELRRKQEYGKPIEIGSDVWVGGAP